ncbi:MAG: redoxin domain-containing protein, partial [Chloroflexi bacterium]|nr:redoxin domain-containing protein [Chloroflexota bacterium]
MNIVPALPRIKAPSILRSRLSLLLLTCLPLLVVAAACSQQSVPTDPAPDFELTLYGTETRQAGETLRLSDLKGKPVVLYFWLPS